MEHLRHETLVDAGALSDDVLFDRQRVWARNLQRIFFVAQLTLSSVRWTFKLLREIKYQFSGVKTIEQRKSREIQDDARNGRQKKAMK